MLILLSFQLLRTCLNLTINYIHIILGTNNIQIIIEDPFYCRPLLPIFSLYHFINIPMNHKNKSNRQYDNDEESEDIDELGDDNSFEGENKIF